MYKCVCDYMTEYVCVFDCVFESVCVCVYTRVASSTYHTRSRGPPPPPPPSDPKGKSKGKGKMDHLSGIGKDNATMVEIIETSYGQSTPAQNELVLHMEQKILELQGELEQV